MTKLSEIEAYCEAATEGPWEDSLDEYLGHWRFQVNHQSEYAWTVAAATSRADAEFIAHAREDLPKLASFVRQLLEDHADDGDGYDPECCAPISECDIVHRLKKTGIEVE